MSTMRNSVMMVGRPTRPTMDTEIEISDIFPIERNCSGLKNERATA